MTNADVITRLADFGYTASETDTTGIDFAIDKATEYICNYCNVQEIPEGARMLALDMACGEFLYTKRAFGTLTLANTAEEIAAKAVKLGDTQITFSDTSSPDALLTDIITYLRRGTDGQLVRFRRLAW